MSSCVPCNSPPPPCSCSASQTCVQTGRSCTECPKNICVDNNTPGNSGGGGGGGGGAAGAVGGAIGGAIILGCILAFGWWWMKKRGRSFGVLGGGGSRKGEKAREKRDDGMGVGGGDDGGDGRIMDLATMVTKRSSVHLGEDAANRDGTLSKRNSRIHQGGPSAAAGDNPFADRHASDVGGHGRGHGADADHQRASGVSGLNEIMMDLGDFMTGARDTGEFSFRSSHSTNIIPIAYIPPHSSSPSVGDHNMRDPLSNALQRSNSTHNVNGNKTSPPVQSRLHSTFSTGSNNRDSISTFGGVVPGHLSVPNSLISRDSMSGESLAIVETGKRVDLQRSFSASRQHPNDPNVNGNGSGLGVSSNVPVKTVDGKPIRPPRSPDLNLKLPTREPATPAAAGQQNLTTAGLGIYPNMNQPSMSPSLPPTQPSPTTTPSSSSSGHGLVGNRNSGFPWGQTTQTPTTTTRTTNATSPPSDSSHHFSLGTLESSENDPTSLAYAAIPVDSRFSSSTIGSVAARPSTHFSMTSSGHSNEQVWNNRPNTNSVGNGGGVGAGAGAGGEVPPLPLPSIPRLSTFSTLSLQGSVSSASGHGHDVSSAEGGYEGDGEEAMKEWKRLQKGNGGGVGRVNIDTSHLDSEVDESVDSHDSGVGAVDTRMLLASPASERFKSPFGDENMSEDDHYTSNSNRRISRSSHLSTASSAHSHLSYNVLDPPQIVTPGSGAAARVQLVTMEKGRVVQLGGAGGGGGSLPGTPGKKEVMGGGTVEDPFSDKAAVSQSLQGNNRFSGGSVKGRRSSDEVAIDMPDVGKSPPGTGVAVGMAAMGRSSAASALSGVASTRNSSASELSLFTATEDDMSRPQSWVQSALNAPPGSSTDRMSFEPAVSAGNASERINSMASETSSWTDSGLNDIPFLSPTGWPEVEGAGGDQRKASGASDTSRTVGPSPFDDPVHHSQTNNRRSHASVKVSATPASPDFPLPPVRSSRLVPAGEVSPNTTYGSGSALFSPGNSNAEYSRPTTYDPSSGHISIDFEPKPSATAEDQIRPVSTAPLAGTSKTDINVIQASPQNSPATDRFPQHDSVANIASPYASGLPASPASKTSSMAPRAPSQAVSVRTGYGSGVLEDIPFQFAFPGGVEGSERGSVFSIATSTQRDSRTGSTALAGKMFDEAFGGGGVSSSSAASKDDRPMSSVTDHDGEQAKGEAEADSAAGRGSVPMSAETSATTSVPVAPAPVKSQTEVESISPPHQAPSESKDVESRDPNSQSERPTSTSSINSFLLTAQLAQQLADSPDS